MSSELQATCGLLGQGEPRCQWLLNCQGRELSILPAHLLRFLLTYTHTYKPPTNTYTQHTHTHTHTLIHADIDIYAISDRRTYIIPLIICQKQTVNDLAITVDKCVLWKHMIHYITITFLNSCSNMTKVTATIFNLNLILTEQLSVIILHI